MKNEAWYDEYYVRNNFLAKRLEKVYQENCGYTQNLTFSQLLSIKGAF